MLHRTFLGTDSLQKLGERSPARKGRLRREHRCGLGGGGQTSGYDILIKFGWLLRGLGVSFLFNSDAFSINALALGALARQQPAEGGKEAFRGMRLTVFISRGEMADGTL